MLRLLFLLRLVTPGPALAGPGGEAGRYMDTDDYIHDAFPDGSPAPRMLWISGDLRDAVERVLGHRFAALRVRYWHQGTKSVWVLDEIGKELPITIGVTVAEGAIDNVRILEFRESRGWEVRYPFFTDQFVDARLEANGRLDRRIDGITGATLSVGAVTRIARVALLLDDNIKTTG
jgi:hypothetical protein